MEPFAAESSCARVTAELTRRATFYRARVSEFEGEAFRLGRRGPLLWKPSCSTTAVGATAATRGPPRPFAAMKFEGEDLRLGASRG